MKKIRKIILLTVIISLTLGFEIISNAQDGATTNDATEQVSASDLEISEPTVLPDSPFYFIKNWMRGLNIALTFDRVKKTQLENTYASEKLVELKKMTEKNASPEKIKKATEKYQQAVEKVKQRADKIKDDAENNPDVNKFLEKFANQQVLQEKILQKLEGQVPQAALEKVREAREQHLEKFKEVMTKLENRNEKIKEKIESALQNGDASNPEILERIKEKMPTEIKEKLSEVKTKIIEKTINKAIEKNENRNCPAIEKPVSSFCKQGKIKTEKDDKGCITKIECLPLEQKACTQEYDPVCGKDNKTYSNKCVAVSSGIGIAYKGGCGKKDETKKCQGDGECPQIMRPCIPKDDGTYDCPPKIKCIDGKCQALSDNNSDFKKCQSSYYFGCQNITQGILLPENLSQAQVCGCIPKCNTTKGEWVSVSVSMADDQWPDGSKKGDFKCVTGPPPPSAKTAN